MYFVKTPTPRLKNHSEQALREQIERERRQLYEALKNAGVENPPVELRIEASNPKADCIFFAYREGLLRGAYDAATFARAYASHTGDSIDTIKEAAAACFEAASCATA